MQKPEPSTSISEAIKNLQLEASSFSAFAEGMITPRDLEDAPQCSPESLMEDDPRTIARLDEISRKLKELYSELVSTASEVF